MQHTPYNLGVPHETAAKQRKWGERMRTLLVNNRGEVEVDPFNGKGSLDRWLASINKDGALNYGSLT
jgi:hypothetical protein